MELQKGFQYTLKEDYSASSSDGDYIMFPSTQDVTACALTKRHMYQVNTALHMVE